MKYGLGRRHAPDPRDENYLLSTLLDQKGSSALQTPKPIEEGGHASQWRGLLNYYDDSQYFFDQGDTPECVEYAWHHFMVDGPIKRRPAPVWPFGTLYNAAQLVDEWPGEDYEGTSVRAGAKVLQSWGLISNYYWAFDADTVARAILNRGPVVIGINWYEDMFEPNEEGILSVSGVLAGGHALEVDGVSLVTGLAKIKNSWNTSWGLGGTAYLSLEDLDRLIKEDGEACMAIEVPV